jgi:hypothetical protein
MGCQKDSVLLNAIILRRAVRERRINETPQVSDVWSRRLGEPAAHLLVKSRVQVRAGFAALLIFLAGEILFQLIHLEIGIVLAIVLFLVGAGLLFASARTQSRARRLAGPHLNLPESSWKLIPVKDSEHFDRWIAARDQAGWPKRISR